MSPGGVLQELRGKLDSHRRELLDLHRGMAEEEAEHQPNGEWSAKQQLAHLCQAEVAWREWALLVSQNSGTEVGQPSEEGQAFTQEVETANSYPLSYWLTRLRLARSETLRQLLEAGLTEKDLEKKGRHRSFGEMTVLQLLRALYRHDRMHAEQVQGKPTSFVPGQGRRSGS